MDKAESQSEKVRSSVTFRVRPGVDAVLRAACRATGMSEGELINDTLDRFVMIVVGQAREYRAQAERELDAMELAKRMGWGAEARQVSSTEPPASPPLTDAQRAVVVAIATLPPKPGAGAPTAPALPPAKAGRKGKGSQP